MSETRVREEIVKLGRSLFDRGLTCGSGGNLGAAQSAVVNLTSLQYAFSPALFGARFFNPSIIYCEKEESVIRA